MQKSPEDFLILWSACQDGERGGYYKVESDKELNNEP